MDKKKSRIAEQLLSTTGFVAISLYIFIGTWIWMAMPTSPDIARGNTIPRIVGGTTVYITPFYNDLLIIVPRVGFVLVLCAGLIDFHKDPFDWRWKRK
jgi:hypothetical protein